MHIEPLGKSGDAEPGRFRQLIAWRQIQFLFMILQIGRMGEDSGVCDIPLCCQRNGVRHRSPMKISA